MDATRHNSAADVVAGEVVAGIRRHIVVVEARLLDPRNDEEFGRILIELAELQRSLEDADGMPRAK